MRTTRRTTLATTLAAGLGLALVGGLASPATAADTLVTFTVDPSGALAVSAPDEVALGDAPGGASVARALGPVTVTDSRNNTASNWAATVSTSDAQHSSSSATIPKTNIVYSSGQPTKTSGGLALTPAGLPAPTALTSVLPVVTTVGGSSGSSVTWTPTLEVRVPAGTPAGTYTMTVTHSVS